MICDNFQAQSDFTASKNINIERQKHKRIYDADIEFAGQKYVPRNLLRVTKIAGFRWWRGKKCIRERIPGNRMKFRFSAKYSRYRFSTDRSSLWSRERFDSESALNENTLRNESRRWRRVEMKFLKGRTLSTATSIHRVTLCPSFVIYSRGLKSREGEDRKGYNGWNTSLQQRKGEKTKFRLPFW